MASPRRGRGAVLATAGLTSKAQVKRRRGWVRTEPGHRAEGLSGDGAKVRGRRGQGLGIETKAPNSGPENVSVQSRRTEQENSGRLLPRAHGTSCSGRLHGPWSLPSCLALALSGGLLWPPPSTQPSSWPTPQRALGGGRPCSSTGRICEPRRQSPPCTRATRQARREKEQDLQSVSESRERVGRRQPGVATPCG